jgi:hypothetical protein
MGMAASLTAQTLSFGEITSVTPATTPPTYQVNVILKTAGSSYANLVAGMQFDLNYDPTQLGVTVGLSSATSPSFQINTTCLGATSFTGCTSLATFNPSTTAAMNNGPGQRAIVVGCCSTTQISNPSTNPVTSNLMADGPVATLTVQPLSGATTTGQTLTLLNLAGTTAGGQNIAAAAVPLTIGAGSNDPNSTGIVDLYHMYLVGDVNTPGSAYPPASQTAPNFGTAGKLNLQDLILMLYVATNAPGYSAPLACSDLFDAMDAAPADTATTRGGDGAIKLADLILVLYRATNAPGYTIWPYRTTKGQTCVGARTAPTAALARPVGETQGTVVLGTPESGGTQDRVPIYLEARRDLSRVAIGFSVGDEHSQLTFSASTAPSIMQDGQPGFIAAAWLDGLTVSAGQRLLLGYVVGPKGSAANLKVFGVSASGLNDNQDVELEVSGAPLVRR